MSPAARRRGPGPEARFQTQVLSLASLGGWMAYHPPDNRAFVDGRGKTRKQAVVAGFPDLTLVHRERPEMIFAELKAEGGRVSEAQRDWLAALARIQQALRDAFITAGMGDIDRIPCAPRVEVCIWVPSDFDAIALRLTGRTWAPVAC
jgi:hypothetical protein